uniref:Uncharacterized protein n=1 Tax=Hemiselmis andersenii TaxID=464988 RepID=A0A7S1HN68_HEMAN|mmetsp:Transcript_8831/g.21630  ORF Transcript_8831/g.21630 Transcript_8831/m.21630 type:complete len:113 (+) Transcript_8831:22-360(+)
MGVWSRMSGRSDPYTVQSQHWVSGRPQESKQSEDPTPPHHHPTESAGLAEAAQTTGGKDGLAWAEGGGRSAKQEAEALREEVTLASAELQRVQAYRLELRFRPLANPPLCGW